MAADNISDQLNTFIDEKYVPLDIKIKAVIFVAFILLPCVGFYFLSFATKAEEIEGLEVQKEKLSETVAKGQQAQKNLEKIKLEIVETEKKFAKAAIVLPKTKEIPDLLRNISDLGKEAGLDFISFKPGSEIPREFYAIIPVDIQIKGPYHNLGYFLDRVSKLERIVSTNNISMGGPKKSGGELLLSSKCRLETYRYTGKSNKQPEKGKRRR